MNKINIQIVHRGENYYKIVNILTGEEAEVSIELGNAVKLMIKSIKIITGLK